MAGRPRGPEKHQVSVKLEPQVIEQANKIAAWRGLNRSEAIGASIVAYFKSLARNRKSR